ncbi:choline dehydrogenase [Cladophialophora psammophila CBS 110553]|uniref:Choline dehydrogenase n=1 Tax=Cladophialophora psammophila CBS 110553 TaxID=1182543 RepID=W9WCW3_9EURO|nr:choline dehydrogenase [Cladophialophora psammophila CBS 110553]EXJ56349.1 choline dehydrogenase [Cladophialophora psammophila CBS 110553]
MKGVLALITVLGTTVSALSGAAHRHSHNRIFKRDNTTQTIQGANTTDPAAYDYVVVGSGPGGGPLASRLAIAGYKVLLIEAGDDQGDAIWQQVPALQLQATEYTPQKWDYFVNHYQDLARQEQDSKMVWKTPAGDEYVGNSPPAGSTPLGIWYPRTGTLGGCSAHNAMISIYPHESDWNNIASITGDSSWSAGNMRKYFERLERCRYLPNSVVGHGFDGWYETSLTELSLAVEDQKLLSLIIAAGTAMGKGLLGMVLSTVAGLGEVLLRDINADVPNRDSQEGLYQVPIAVSEVDKKRIGARDFILATANAVNADGSRKYHLDIKLHTLVTKVRFDISGPNPKAIGVDYLEGKSLYRADPRSGGTAGGTPGSVNANREVIISGGAFNSPQLLKLSGIGPASELSNFGIPVVVDLPGVGTNLQDRYEATIVGDSNTDFAITKDCTFLRTQPDPCLEQWQNLPGPSLKGTYATNGIAIAVVKKSSVADGDPDLLVSGAPAFFTGYHPGYANESLKDAHHWAWIVLKAHSRNNAGTITLRSSDPRDTPVINFNYFDTGNTADGADDKDLQATYEGMQLSRKMFQDYIPLQGTFKEVWPGNSVKTEAQMKDWIKKEAWGHHASCTCPIGADDDEMAVLDSNFRVRGVDGLRVVDASVFPKIPGFYIVLPTYMISEKAADAVLEDAAKIEGALVG